MNATIKTTMKDAQYALAKHGINIRKTGYGNEYRISYKGILNAENSAYYTDDIVDAIYTGMAMSENRAV